MTDIFDSIDVFDTIDDEQPQESIRELPPGAYSLIMMSRDGKVLVRDGKPVKDMEE